MTASVSATRRPATITDPGATTAPGATVDPEPLP